MSPKMLSDENIKEMIGIEKIEKEMKKHQESSELSEDEILDTLHEWSNISNQFYTSLGKQKEQIANNTVNRGFSTMIDRQKEIDRKQKEIDKMLEERDSTKNSSRNRKRHY